jgi:hypothetical protein
MKLDDMKEGLLVRDGRTLLRVRRVSPPSQGGTGYVTALVLLEGRPSVPPGRTKVRTYVASDIEMFFDPATKGQIKAYEAAYSSPNTQ